jgi:hypothetical protein
MCNDFHLLLKVTPRPKVPLSEAELLKRFGGLYSGVGGGGGQETGGGCTANPQR